MKIMRKEKEVANNNLRLFHRMISDHAFANDKMNKVDLFWCENELCGCLITHDKRQKKCLETITKNR